MVRNAFLAVLLLLPAASHGQTAALTCAEQVAELCGDDDTVLDCALAINPIMAGLSETTAQAGEEEKAETADAVAAATKSTDLGGTTSSRRDLLSKFFVGLGLGTANEEEDGDLVLQLKPEILELGPENPLLVQLVVHKPVVFDKLVDAHPETGRADFREALESKLDGVDDAELQLTWTRNSDRYGFRSEAFIAAFEAVSSVAGPDSTAALMDKLAELGESASRMTIGALRLSEPDKARAFQELAQRNTCELESTVTRLHEKLSAIEFDKLVRNQPQLAVDGGYRQRGGVTGPDEWSLKATWELGLVNLNKLDKQCDLDGSANPALLVACMENYTTDHKAALDSSPRIAFKGEYGEIAAFDFASSALAQPFHSDRAHKAIASITAGKYFLRKSKDTGDTAVDLEASYEDISGDPKRNDRLVATLTFSQKLSAGNLLGRNGTGALSLVYANKPEFLPEVDRDLSVHVGLKWNWAEEKAAE